MKKLLIILSVIIVAAAVVYYAFPEKITGFLISQARSSAGLTKKEVRIGDHNIVYLESPAGRDTILLLHGFAANKDNWLVFSQYLKDYHVVIPDIPGFGESSKIPQDKYDAASQVERLHNFSRAIKINKFHVAGNSMGGWFAGAYAARYPAEIISVGLFAPAGVKPPHLSVVMKMMEKGDNPLVLKSEKDFDRLMNLLFVKHFLIPYPFKEMFLREAVANRSFNQKIMTGFIPGAFSLEKDLPKIKAPALILWGDQDKILDISSVSVFEKGIANHKTVIIKNCGHVPMVEKPKETADAYLSFIRNVSK